MPPRGNNEGLDFTPILTHYLFLFTSILAVLAWFIAFIGQAVATADFGNSNVGVLWFAIFLQLFLILGVGYTLASNSIGMYRFQISVFGAIAIVFAVIGVNQGIFSGVASLDAMAAGWLILAIVDILWVLYFTSEEDSLVLHIFNSLGTGGLTPPRRRRTRNPPSVHGIASGNGYANNYSTTGGIGNDPYEAKLGNGAGSGGFGGGIGIRSQNSFNAGSLDGGMANRSMGGGTGAGSIHNTPGGGGGASIGGADTNAPTSPLMAGIGAGGPGGTSSDTSQLESYSYKAKALYAYTASPDDPNEISFSKGETLDIVDKQGKWWQAKKEDGTVGIAPSNYLQII